MESLGKEKIVALFSSLARVEILRLFLLHPDRQFYQRQIERETGQPIRAVQRGEVYIYPSMTRALLADVLPDAPAVETHDGDRFERLSERERQVLRLVALGHTNQQIADMLYLSVKTVETYRARAMDKLELRSRAALVRYALQRGLLK
jgi:DNA-binding NarL/FixJ family response regulator